MSDIGLPFGYVGFDLDKMDSKWKKEFIDEVEAGNFVRGGKSLLLVGDDADKGLAEWLACLALAGYKVYGLSPYEAVCRMINRPVFRDSEQRKANFEEAECIVLFDFRYELPEQYLFEFMAYLQTLMRDGVVVVAGTDSDDKELPEPLMHLMEQNFEAIRVQTNEEKTDKGGKRNRKDGGDDADSVGAGRQKHKGIKRNRSRPSA